MTRWADHTFEVADVLGSEVVSTGEVRVDLGDELSGDGWDKGVAMWGLDGFITRPNERSADGVCQALFVYDGNTRRVIGSRDNRFAQQAGALAPGDRAIVTDGPARFFLKRETDTISLYTEHGGTSMAATLDGSTGTISLFNASGCVIEMRDSEIVLAAGGTMLVLNADGLAVFGKHCALNTGGGNLGTLGPIPPPVATNAILYGASSLEIPSTKWTVG